MTINHKNGRRSSRDRRLRQKENFPLRFKILTSVQQVFVLRQFSLLRFALPGGVARARGVTEMRHPQCLKRQRVRRSKVATRAQHSRAAPVAQIYTAELG